MIDTMFLLLDWVVADSQAISSPACCVRCSRKGRKFSVVIVRLCGNPRLELMKRWIGDAINEYIIKSRVSPAKPSTKHSGCLPSNALMLPPPMILNPLCQNEIQDDTSLLAYINRGTSSGGTPVNFNSIFGNSISHVNETITAASAMCQVRHGQRKGN